MSAVRTVRPRALVRVSTALVLLALGASACSGAVDAGSAGHAGSGDTAQKSGEQAVRIIEGHPYAVDSSPTAAIEFPMNENVFEGTVVERRPDVYAKDVLDDGSTFEVVYTPVVVRVDEVHKGGLKEGSEVVLRSMGGTADGVRYEIEEAPAKRTFAKGASLVVFGSEHEAVDSETDPAMTPNFLYRETGDTVVDATYAGGAHDGGPADRMGQAEFRSKLRSLSAKTAS